MKKLGFSIVASTVIAGFSFIVAAGAAARCTQGLGCIGLGLMVLAAPVIGFIACFLFTTFVPEYRLKIFLSLVIILLPFALYSLWVSFFLEAWDNKARAAIKNATLIPVSDSTVVADESFQITLKLRERSNMIREVLFDVERNFLSKEESEIFYKEQRSKKILFSSNKVDDIERNCKGCNFTAMQNIPSNFGGGYIRVCAKVFILFSKYPSTLCSERVYLQ